LLTKRIIPCLDIKDGRVVKGINFENLRDAGDPVTQAEAYARLGADELVFLDISAGIEKRKTLSALVRKIASVINIPFTVGGGISSVNDVSVLLEAGADKVSVNSAIVERPDLINELAKNFGSQCIVAAIDSKKIDGIDYVFLHGGRTQTQLKTLDWAMQAQQRGAGEILLTSMDHDGTKQGFDLKLTGEMSTLLNIPVIASGGAGKMEHFFDVFNEGKADAALAASVFHYGEIAIPELKKYLLTKEISIRI